jgi:hypothetical protein
MIIRQRFFTNSEVMFIEYHFDESGLLVETKEVNRIDFRELDKDVLFVPRVEVTEEFFEALRRDLRV